jgi:hypothetical protein
MTNNPSRNGKNQQGRFMAGNKFGSGRPRGARNKPVDTGPIIALGEEPRSPMLRRFRELLGRIIIDLGGEENLSTGELQLARRCAWISTQCEVLEQKAEPGEPFELTIYTILTSHLTRTLSVLGLKRQPRDVTPTLRDYLAAVRQPMEEEME